MYRKNVAGQNLGFCLVNASTGAALTGATVTVKKMADGAAQASATGTVSEGGSGQYNFALSQADTNGNEISFLFTAASGVPVEKTIVCTAADPTDSVRLGLTAIPNAAANANGGLPILSNGGTTLGYTITTLTTYTGNTPQTGDAFARIGNAGAGLTGLGDARLANLDAAISTRSTYAGGAVASVTGAVGSVTAAVNVNLAQTGLTPRALDAVADAALTVGDALVAALAAAAGKESVSGTSYVVKTPSTGTVIRTFTLDSSSAPTSRT